MSSLSDFSATRLLGGQEALADYAGKVVLVVNVASSCGYTPQYAGLEQIWQDYRDRGVVVLGFPCNQFGNQEAGSELEIATFCSTTYNVTFPMFSKITVKGAEKHPLYAALSEKSGEPKWNFHKYLVGKNGEVISGYKSGVAPLSPELIGAIDTALAG